MTLVEIANLKLAIGTVLAQAFIVVALVYLFCFRGKYKGIEAFMAKYAVLFAFIVALVSMLSSLFYSEVAHYAPCELCWYQRIFMYSLVFILGLALLKKDRSIIDYALLLSGAGFIIAGYQSLMQLGIMKGACDLVGYSVSCSKLFVMQFGYITIPLMALTGFALIIVFLYFAKIRQKGYNEAIH